MSQEKTSKLNDDSAENKDIKDLEIRNVDAQNLEKEDKGVEQKDLTSDVSDDKKVLESNKKPKTSSFLTSSVPAKEEPKLSEEIDMKKIQEEHLEKSIKDEILFKSKCTLYFFSKKKKKFEERGYGTIMVNKHRTNEMIKIVMIRDGIMRYGCNHYINPMYRLDKNEKVPNSLVWITTGDSVESDAPRDARQIFLVKFEEEEAFIKFKEEFDKGRIVNKQILES